MEIREVLDLGHRQHAHVRVTLGETKNDGFVEQGIEHALVAEGFVQALGDRVDPALLRHVLAEQQGLGILAEQIVQRLVDLDREMLRRLFFRQFRLATERVDAFVGVIGSRRLGLDLVRRVRRQWTHHVFQRG